MCAYEDCQQAHILYGLSDLHKGWCLKVLVFLCECAYELITDNLIAVSQFIHIVFFFSLFVIRIVPVHLLIKVVNIDTR